MTVVDGEDRIVGIITFDDVMDVIEEEATEDIEKMAAILPSDLRAKDSSTVALGWREINSVVIMDPAESLG